MNHVVEHREGRVGGGDVGALVAVNDRVHLRGAGGLGLRGRGGVLGEGGRR